MEQVPGWRISSPQLLEKVQTGRRLGNHGVDVFRPLKVNASDNQGNVVLEKNA